MFFFPFLIFTGKNSDLHLSYIGIKIYVFVGLKLHGWRVKNKITMNMYISWGEIAFIHAQQSYGVINAYMVCVNSKNCHYKTHRWNHFPQISVLELRKKLWQEQKDGVKTKQKIETQTEKRNLLRGRSHGSCSYISRTGIILLMTWLSSSLPPSSLWWR